MRCYITDRRIARLPLAEHAARAISAGADLIQLREKDLDGRELLELARVLVRVASEGGARVVVNSRADVALAAGAAGVHLPAGSPPAKEWKRLGAILAGVSCHTVSEVEEAERGGADYCLFGPVFESISKPGYGPGPGLAGLRAAAGRVRIPVLALGGVTEENEGLCLDAGAAGVAAISRYQRL